MKEVKPKPQPLPPTHSQKTKPIALRILGQVIIILKSIEKKGFRFAHPEVYRSTLRLILKDLEIARYSIEQHLNTLTALTSSSQQKKKR